MNAELQDLLADHQIFHSAFQMDYCITARAGLTTWGCYKQALRELDGRYRSLRDLYIKAEELKAERNIADDATRAKLSENHRVLAKAKLFKAQASVQDIEPVIADTEREFLHFLGQVRGLKAKLLEGGELTEERKARLEADYWKEYARQRIERDKTANQISPETREFIEALPFEISRPLLSPLKIDVKPHHVLTGIAVEPQTFDFGAVRGDIHKSLCGEQRV